MRHQSDVDEGKLSAPLLVRPARLPGEWARSWVFRTAQANAVLAWRQWFEDEAAASIRKRLDRVTFSRGDVNPYAERRVLFCGHLLPHEDVRQSGSSVEACGACLRDSRSVPVVWRLHGYTCCHIHHTPLVNRCLHCQRQLNLTAVIEGKCACGSDPTFADSGTQATSKRVGWGRHVWPSGVVDPSTMAPETLAMAAFRARLLMTVARSRRGRDLALMDFHPAEHVEEWLVSDELEQAFSHGDVAVFLDALRHPVHRRAAALFIQNRLHAESASPTVLSTLPLQAWLLKVAPNGEVDSGRGRLASLPYSARRPGFEPLVTAAKRWGLRSSQLKALLSQDELPEPIPFVAGRRLQLVDSTRADSVCRALPCRTGDSLDPAPMVSQWAMPRTVSRQLRLSGWLTTDRRAHPLPQSLAERAGTLLTTLRARAVPVGQSSGKTIALTDPALYSRALSTSVGAFYSDLVTGAVPLYTRATQPDFQDLSVPVGVLPRFWWAYRANVALKRCRSVDQGELF